MVSAVSWPRQARSWLHCGHARSPAGTAIGLSMRRRCSDAGRRSAGAGLGSLTSRFSSSRVPQKELFDQRHDLLRLPVGEQAIDDFQHRAPLLSASVALVAVVTVR